MHHDPATKGLLFPLVMLFTVACGCGGGELPTYRAGGKVTFPDGKPLTGGSVELKPADPAHLVSARGQIQPDGTFQLGTYQPGDGAIEGEHLVAITPPPPLGDRDEMKTLPVVIDPRFQRFETSGLKVAVSRDAGKNQFPLRVEPPKR